MNGSEYRTRELDLPRNLEPIGVPPSHPELAQASPAFATTARSPLELALRSFSPPPCSDPSKDLLSDRNYPKNSSNAVLAIYNDNITGKIVTVTENFVAISFSNRLI